MTQEEIDALKAQGFRFKATPEGEVRFTPEEEAEWDAMEAGQAEIPPARRLVKKSTVMSRLLAMGKAATVRAAFDANPEADFRWHTPDWPNVYADDDGLLAFLDGIGLTEAQVAEVTAP